MSQKRLYELIYGSVETRYLSAMQLSELLTLARARNQSLDVTGVLLHQKGVFIQVLEGGREPVSLLCASIVPACGPAQDWGWRLPAPLSAAWAEH